MTKNRSKGNTTYLRSFILLYLILLMTFFASAQEKKTVIQAKTDQVLVKDGNNVELNWRLNPNVRPDTYFINIPFKNSEVQFITDTDQIRFQTKPGKSYEFIILLNGKDSCYIKVTSTHPPTSVTMENKDLIPHTIPFTLIGSRVYFKGNINGNIVNIQLDLGAGTNVVNKNVSDKLGLEFTKQTLVSNTEGVNLQRTSVGNSLNIDGVIWSGVPVTEVGNMKPHEDLIIGNGLFINKIIEINYDTKEFTILSKLPANIRSYSKLPVFYEQNRPKFKAQFTHQNKLYDFWFLFDTGRDGTMLIGEDFTSKNNHWNELVELMKINGRKIILLDATIGGVEFKDIVTNAADPAQPQGRPSLFGNQILSHFNVILDNVNGTIYLKPNSRTNEPYSNYNDYLNEVSKTKSK